jgi:hypothetical protein
LTKCSEELKNEVEGEGGPDYIEEKLSTSHDDSQTENEQGLEQRLLID